MQGPGRPAEATRGTTTIAAAAASSHTAYGVALRRARTSGVRRRSFTDVPKSAGEHPEAHGSGNIHTEFLSPVMRILAEPPESVPGLGRIHAPPVTVGVIAL